MAMKDIRLLTVYFPEPSSSCRTISSVFRRNVTERDLEEDLHTFTWTVDTKYFTADVPVCCCPDHFFDNLVSDQHQDVLSNELSSVEAVLLLADLNEEKCIENVQRIIKTVAEREVEVCLLYTPTETTNSQLKDEINSLCIQNHFEMIENIQPDVEEEEDEEDAFAEKHGVDRVVEALKSHVWSNHVMKNNNSTSSRGGSQLNPLDALLNPSTSSSSGGGVGGLAEELCDGGDDMSFQELFGKFLTMKETAKCLEGDERKEYAANVAAMFMEALGVEDGLSSEEGEEEEGIR